MKKFCKSLIVLFIVLFVGSSLASAQNILNLSASISSATVSISNTSNTIISSGLGSCWAQITPGTKINISVSPGPGTCFINWIDGSSNIISTSYSVQITMPTSNNVLYTALLGYTLTTTPSPSAGGTVSGAGNYVIGNNTTITATPFAGYSFSGWSGDASGSTNPTTVSMVANKSVTATFTASTPMWQGNGTKVFYNTNNVGIGTMNPSEKLEVAGNVKATKFIGDGTGLTNIGLWSLSGSNIFYTTGNVGIGKTPTVPLDVNGAINASGNISAGSFTTAGTINATGIITANKFVGNGSGLTGIGLWGISSSNIYYNTGNVGIGLNNPSTILQIAKTDASTNLSLSNTAAIDIWNMSGSANTGAQINFRSDGNSGASGIGAVIGYVNMTSTSTAGSAGNLVFGVKKLKEDATITPAITIQQGGYVGIGTSTPQTALHVNGDLRVDGTIFHRGTLKSQEINVEVPNGAWKDYVFAPSYRLKSLKEVEQYIHSNGHLPEIPSAKEVEQNGISVGDMQAKLLQKVEELTLYSIEQDKKLAEQAKKNQALEQEINELRELITKK